MAALCSSMNSRMPARARRVFCCTSWKIGRSCGSVSIGRAGWMLRVVVATNRSVEEAVRAGSFREDLYHRLGSLVVRMPALKDHADDIPAIAAAILARRAVEAELASPRLTPRDLARLQSFDWPGNVRELENALLHLLAVGALPASLTVPRACWRARLDATLLRHGGNKAAAARHLGISRRTLYKALAGWSADDPAVPP